MEIKNLQLKIGDYEVHAVPTGEFGLDGGAMFGTVPKVLWEKSNPADEKNRIRMEARALLLKSPHRNILIDCGNGSDFIEKYGEKAGSKFAEIYKIDQNGNSLIKSLSKQGLKPENIDAVILTHLHFDHCGGGTKSLNGPTSEKKLLTFL
ncbi:MAG: MBL fold metallo-hydrolase [Bdellovibrionaceae bacterium]|nr:MBL fold metallo-hydrolase [Pseudobdellovibrionaceae bacterium]